MSEFLFIDTIQKSPTKEVQLAVTNELTVDIKHLLPTQGS